MASSGLDRIGSAAAFAACAALASAAFPATTHWGKVDATPGFSGWREEFQHMVDKEGHGRVNHFCVVVASGPTAPPDDSYTWAYVYWRERSLLYTFGQSDEGMSDASAFKAPLNLKTDVVASRRLIGSSTYLETRAWVENVMRHCAQDGTRVVVERSR